MRRRTYSNKDYIEIAGIKWAKGNLIADPEDITGMTSIIASRQDMYTDYYQWGRKKAWPATGSVTGWDSSTYVGNNWLTENDPSPSGWRIPTRDEFQLLKSIGWSWRAAGSIYGNDVAGAFFGGNHAIATIDNLQGCIFLPACGYRYYNTGDHGNVGTEGDYWSSNRYDSVSALNLRIQSTGVNAESTSGRANGFALRCVKK